MDWLRAGVAQGVQNRNLRTTLVCCRLPPRCQGTRRSHPVTGSPPSGMKAPTRPRGLSPMRANMSGRPGNRSKRGIVRKTGGRVLSSASPRAQEPALARHVPLHSLCHAGRSAAGGNQWRGWGNIISLRFITGKSSVPRPNTHRAIADMPAITQRQARPPQKPSAKNGQNPPINLFDHRPEGGIIAQP
jgi:hypothetical protein